METFPALLAICAGNHRSPVKSPHKGQWRGTLMFSLIWARINCWVNTREAGDLRRHRAHYDVIVMMLVSTGRKKYADIHAHCERKDQGLILKMGSTFISVWINNHISSNVWNGISHPFSNFNCAAVKVWERINNFIPNLMMGVITYTHGIKVNPC